MNVACVDAGRGVWGEVPSVVCMAMPFCAGAVKVIVSGFEKKKRQNNNF